MALFGVKQKRILAFSITERDTSEARAYWDGTRLVVLSVKTLRNEDSLERIAAELNKASESDWVTLVEDRTMSFPSLGVPFSFDAIDVEVGKTKMQVALDHYFTLRSRGLLILGEGLKRFDLRGGEGGIVDFDTNDKGQQVYKINWERIGSGHKAILLCVVGATLEEPRSERWMRAYLEAEENVNAKRDPLSSWTAITTTYAKTLQEQYYESVQNIVEATKHG